MPGMARAASVSAGKVCTTSPSEDVLINSTRKLFNLDRVADQAIQRLDHWARLELAQAVVMAETAGAVEARAALQPQTDDFHLLGQRRGKAPRGPTGDRHPPKSPPRP